VSDSPKSATVAAADANAEAQEQAQKAAAEAEAALVGDVTDATAEAEDEDTYEEIKTRRPKLYTVAQERVRVGVVINAPDFPAE
jgi:hypothetical protein